jgi:hypothetical protein
VFHHWCKLTPLGNFDEGLLAHVFILANVAGGSRRHPR